MCVLRGVKSGIFGHCEVRTGFTRTEGGEGLGLALYIEPLSADIGSRFLP